MVNINFSNKFAYTVIALVLLSLVAIGITAYGGNQPAIMGHSANELEPPAGCLIGQVLRLSTTSPNAWNCMAAQTNISTGLTACAGANLSIKTINPSTGAITCETDDFGSGGGGISSTGSSNYLSKFTTSGNVLGNSLLYETGGKIGVGTTTPAGPSNSVQVNGAVMATDIIGAGCELGQYCNNAGGYSVLYPDGNILTSSNITLGGAIKSIAGDVVIQLG